MAASATQQLKADVAFFSDASLAPQCSCDVALDSEVGQAYNEEAFRYFLEIERKRAEVTNRPLLLLLVDVKTQSAVNEQMSDDVAARLFDALLKSLRETDFVGWYRQDRVVGAVLIQRAESSSGDLAPDVRGRVASRLSGQLPAGLARRIQVRAFQLPSRGDEPITEQVHG